MKKLIDINCNWIVDDDYIGIFEKGEWNGRILLEEDGWFEGIVQDKNSSYLGNRFVFGIYHPDKAIKLIKVSPGSVSLPFIFKNEKKSDSYKGIFSVIKTFEEISYGYSSITTKEVTYTEEDKNKRIYLMFEEEKSYENDVEKLLNKINAFKEIDDFKNLYDRISSMRKEMAEAELRGYVEKNYSIDEQQKTMKDYLEEVEKAQLDYKKDKKHLTRKLTDKFLNEDQLPFA